MNLSLMHCVEYNLCHIEFPFSFPILPSFIALKGFLLARMLTVCWCK